jgi:hypothetical protein
VGDIGVGADDAATLPEPEPQITDVDIPDVAAVAGVAPPTANPPPS